MKKYPLIIPPAPSAWPSPRVPWGAHQLGVNRRLLALM